MRVSDEMINCMYISFHNDKTSCLNLKLSNLNLLGKFETVNGSRILSIGTGQLSFNESLFQYKYYNKTSCKFEDKERSRQAKTDLTTIRYSVPSPVQQQYYCETHRLY